MRGQQIHNRHYGVSTTYLSQITWLKECNEYFGYQSNFNMDFDMIFCSACNSKYDRTKILKTTQILSKSPQNNEIEMNL